MRSIERVHPLKVLGYDPRLVGLQLADVVPGQRQVAQLGELRQRFLCVVLGEVLLAELGHSADRRGRLRFRNGDEPHGIGTATVPHCSGCDAVPCFGKSLPYIARARAAGLISRKVRTS